MSIMTTSAVLSTPAADWSARFDQAQRAYRERNRKPVALVLEADPLPMVASPLDGIGDLRDPAFYEKFQWSPELVARRLAVIGASVDRINAEMDEAEADAAEAVPFDDPAWDADPAFWGLGEEAPAPLSVEELLRGVPFHGTDGPASRRADGYDLASAEHSGWTLGFEGFEADEINPPQHYGADEANAFITGVEAGSAERWASYGRYLDELDRERTLEALHADPFRDVEEHELAEARMSRPAMAMA